MPRKRRAKPKSFDVKAPSLSVRIERGRPWRSTASSTTRRTAMVDLSARARRDRLKRLPRHHRIAHLRALIGLQPEGCGHRDELSELVREEIADASNE